MVWGRIEVGNHPTGCVVDVLIYTQTAVCRLGFKFIIDGYRFIQDTLMTPYFGDANYAFPPVVFQSIETLCSLRALFRQ